MPWMSIALRPIAFVCKVIAVPAAREEDGGRESFPYMLLLGGTGLAM